jgi:hypothetical protein
MVFQTLDVTFRVSLEPEVPSRNQGAVGVVASTLYTGLLAV